jgi:ribonuclease HII
VVAAAVVLPKKYRHPLLNDSKQLTRSERDLLRIEIERDALDWAVAEVSHIEIDSINILNASFKAMHHAIVKLKVIPTLLLIDGNRFSPFPEIPHECIIKGDGKFLSIAAASVLAKTYRDELMTKLSAEFPGYGWETNMGYPTEGHRDGIRKLGITPYHRKTFQLLPAQLELFNPEAYEVCE